MKEKKAEKKREGLFNWRGTRQIKSQQGPRETVDGRRATSPSWAAERGTAAAGHPDLEEEEVQWENRIAEWRERENAVWQGQVWATGSNNLGGAGV